MSTSAFCQARQKLKHTAFIELLEDCTLAQFYEYDFDTYQGHRLVAIDGSALRLPNSSELCEEFGTIRSENRYHETHHAEAKASIAYDLLNKLPLHGVLARARTSDVSLAELHIPSLRENDLVVMDRGYASYKLFSELQRHNIDFVVRCPRRRFSDGAGLFKEPSIRSKTVELAPTGKLVGDDSLLPTVQTRFISVTLPSGEIEVLITSLTDNQRYPHNSFKDLYRQRWGIETYYHLLKSRLSVEHFTGLSVESVKQDFFSTLYISALETVVTEDAERTLSEKETRHAQKVNKNISFGLLKEYAFEILYDQSIDQEKQQLKLTRLFQQNPTLIRPKRANPRHRRNWASGYFQRNRKKHAF